MSEYRMTVKLSRVPPSPSVANFVLKKVVDGLIMQASMGTMQPSTSKITFVFMMD